MVYSWYKRLAGKRPWYELTHQSVAKDKSENRGTANFLACLRHRSLRFESFFRGYAEANGIMELSPTFLETYSRPTSDEKNEITGFLDDTFNGDDDDWTYAPPFAMGSLGSINCN